MKALGIVSYSLLAALFLFFSVGQAALAKEMKSVLPKSATDVGVQRDGDDALLRGLAHDQGYSDDDDALLAPTTGSSTLDAALRFVWNNVGKLILVFALLLAAALFGARYEHETHNDRMRREAEELAEAANDDIHAPFDAPEGMQPTSQYESIRTRH